MHAMAFRPSHKNIFFALAALGLARLAELAEKVTAGTQLRERPTFESAHWFWDPCRFRARLDPTLEKPL
jgi:hypothetical protein